MKKKIWQTFNLKKLAFSLLQFYEAAKAGKKLLLRQTLHWELWSATNMFAKIDIDALKKKSRRNDAENQKKKQQPVLTQDLLLPQKKNALGHDHFEKF